MSDEIKMPDAEAVALVYDEKGEAPRVVAKGVGWLAEKIVAVAEAKNVPVHTDSELVKSLSALPLGDYIPPALYEVVAQVYVFIEKIDAIMRERENIR